MYISIVCSMEVLVKKADTIQRYGSVQRDTVSVGHARLTL